jgi:carboxylate-amine ligase
VRPHAYFKTLEFRICDIPCRADETIAIAALTQALVVKLYRLFEANLGVRDYARAIVMENKFRALRTGLSGKMIDFGLKGETDTRALILEVLAFVDDVVDDLGSRGEMIRLREWAQSGDTGADRQLRVFEATNDLRSVVDMLVDETKQGL